MADMADFPDDLTQITAKLAKREMELLRFWNLTNDVLVILKRGIEGKVVIDRVSPSVEEVLGWDPDEIREIPLCSLTHGPAPSFPDDGVRGLKTKWKSKPKTGFPEAVELVWTSSPWTKAEDGEEKCYAVARPSLKNGVLETPDPTIQRRWTPMVNDDSISPMEFDSSRKR